VSPNPDRSLALRTLLIIELFLTVTLTDTTSYDGKGYTRYGKFFFSFSRDEFASLIVSLEQVSNTIPATMVELLGSSMKLRVGEFSLQR
jgi:hypothetical protein